MIRIFGSTHGLGTSCPSIPTQLCSACRLGAFEEVAAILIIASTPYVSNGSFGVQKHSNSNRWLYVSSINIFHVSIGILFVALGTGFTCCVSSFARLTQMGTNR
jgi:hypothetical protein